jgi:hypothetical protein
LIDELPATAQNLERMEEIARDAFNARNASRTASQARQLPLGRLVSRLMDRSGTAARTFEALLASRTAKAGGDLARGYRALAVGAGRGNTGATWLARAGGFASRGLAVAGIALSAYSLYEDIRTENYGATIGDAAGIVSGGAVLVGAAPVAAIATGVMAANMAGDFVESAVTPHFGREAGVAAGTLAGAGVGAAAGAAIGVLFFGVGAPIGAAIGAVIGAVIGFIGAYW